MDFNILAFFTEEAVLTNFMKTLSIPSLTATIFICIVVLSKSSDIMIDGVVKLAHKTGLPKIIIGATIVSLGTTTPEAFVSVMAALKGNSGLALGNGVGSIITDTGLILGLMGLFARIPLDPYIINKTGWVQVGAATLLVVISSGCLLLSNGEPILSRPVGFLFLFLLFVYIYFSYIWAKNSDVAVDDTESTQECKDGSQITCLLQIIGGLFFVILGAKFLIPAACETAVRFNVSEDVIAVTMVAFGTSVPELITAISAIRKGHPEIMIGNIVGADVLNCLFVVGAAAAAEPISIPPNFFRIHFPALLIIIYSFRVFIFMDKDGFFKKWQGGILLTFYLLYLYIQFFGKMIDT